MAYISVVLDTNDTWERRWFSGT